MRKPQVGKPRSATAPISLSRRMPKLNLPRSAPFPVTTIRHPQIARPAIRPAAAAVPPDDNETSE